MTDVPARSPGRVQMDPRIRARRVAVRRDEGRRRLRVLLGVLALAGAVGAGAGVLRSPLLDVDHVRVTGARRTPLEAVLEAAAIRDGSSMVSVDGSTVAGRVRGLPWVADVDVERRWPGTVVLTVHERRAVAAVRADGTAWMLLDASGRQLEVVPVPPPDLPAIEGSPRAARPGASVPATTRAALAIARAIPSDRVGRVRVVAMLPDGTFELRLAPEPHGGVVRFGDASAVAAKPAATFTVLDRVDTTRLAVLDVRVPDAPVVTRVAPPPRTPEP